MILRVKKTKKQGHRGRKKKGVEALLGVCMFSALFGRREKKKGKRWKEREKQRRF